jgi:hypothetical protein
MSLDLCKYAQNTTTHFGFCKWPLQLHTSEKKHMRLMINELLNPCRFAHLVARDV